MSTTETTRTFPTDWNEWRKQFDAWATAYGLKRSPKALRGKNFMADEIIGTYSLAGGVVELSEVTFPGFGAEDRGKTFRYVGLTWLGQMDQNINGGLVDSFDDLEASLVAGCPDA